MRYHFSKIQTVTVEKTLDVLFSDYYYDILGVSRGSTTSEIKMAYRQLAKKLHPDRKALEEDTDGKQFGELVEAYKVNLYFCS